MGGSHCSHSSHSSGLSAPRLGNRSLEAICKRQDKEKNLFFFFNDIFNLVLDILCWVLLVTFFFFPVCFFPFLKNPFIIFKRTIYFFKLFYFAGLIYFLFFCTKKFAFLDLLIYWLPGGRRGP